ncbi:hypothetical protein JHW43_005433 [Diplocarpon mali]|nr:hypothetical protein JHW43_005433 [Diplocarpon mali]
MSILRWLVEGQRASPWPGISNVPASLPWSTSPAHVTSPLEAAASICMKVVGSLLWKKQGATRNEERSRLLALTPTLHTYWLRSLLARFGIAREPRPSAGEREKSSTESRSKRPCSQPFPRRASGGREAWPLSREPSSRLALAQPAARARGLATRRT